MITELEIPKAKRNSSKNKVGDILVPASTYNPSEEVKKRTQSVMERFSRSAQLMTKPFEEFNDKSVIQRMSDDQKLFNNWREPKSNDPDKSWRSNAVRPIVRNRTISIAAHLTGQLIVPNVRAQNDKQEEDKAASTVIRDLLDWANDQAEYIKTFVYAVIAALVNPASIIHTEYVEQYRTIKEINENGTWTEKRTLDEIMSGFRDTLVPLDEFFIADAYQHDIQKQSYVIWRKAIPYQEAEIQYGNAANWKYVKPGVQAVFDSTSNSFYDIFDPNLIDILVEKVIYYDRYNDLQLCFINGILMTDPEQPMKRKDKLYPFVKGGYELIDEGKFFYYYSLVRKMADDAEIINTLYQMVIDGTYLKVMPPTAVYGDVTIASQIMTPRKITNLPGENMKIEPLGVNSDLNAGFAMLNKLESSVSESSNDVQQAGLTDNKDKTAFQVSVEERNAAILGGMVRRMIGFMVRDWTRLRLGDILQFMTVAEIDEIVGDDATLKYKSFLIPDKSEQGKSVNHRILFQNENIPSPEQILAMEGGMKEEDRDISGYLKKGIESDQRIYIVNPTLFRELKYKVVVTPDIEKPVSETLERVMNLEEYDRAINSPFANQENLYRDLLLGSYKKTRDDVDKYTKKPEEMMPQQGQPQSPLSKIFGSGVQNELNANAGVAPKVGSNQ